MIERLQAVLSRISAAFCYPCAIMRTDLKTHDEYLATLPAKQRATLQKLRKLIRSIAPKAEEYITYGIPAFKHNGQLVGYAAAKTHYSLFPMNGGTVAAFKNDLKGFSSSKGTVRFTDKEPLPDALVRKIVRFRLAQNAAAKKPAKKSR
jgi:uncharacterized protein YdhG (YjbR/CyaY superfamily)